MIVSDNLWVDVLVFSALGLSVLSLGAVLICFSMMRKQAATHMALFQKLGKSLQVSDSGAVGLGKRLVTLEQQFLNSAETGQLQDEPSRPASPALLDESLKDAMSLLNAGLSPEEVARRCGISKAEASLMKLMRAQSPQAA